MNKFELYCIIFYVWDAEWEDTHDEQLGEYLSSANPFLFEEIGSAVKNIYLEYSKQTPDYVSLSESYDVALKYVQSLHKKYLLDAFLTIDRNDWNNSVQDYLASPHKGSKL